MPRRRIVPTLVMLALVLMALPAADSGAATIKLSDYWFSKGLGDSWTYGYTQPSGVPDFTVAITLISGDYYTGKYRFGDHRDPYGLPYYLIVSYDNNFFYIYYDSETNQTFPPAQIPFTQPLETMLDNPLNPTNSAWYFKRVASLTVPAGTYSDILLRIDLNKDFSPNAGNTYFELPGTIPYGVTNATWYARHVGEVQNINFNQAGEVGDTYVLESTNTKPWSGTDAALMLMLFQ
jgi:hypothetical protein